LVGKGEGKKPLGKPKRRWEYNINTDLKENWDSVDWIHLTLDGDKCVHLYTQWRTSSWILWGSASDEDFATFRVICFALFFVDILFYSSLGFVVEYFALPAVHLTVNKITEPINQQNIMVSYLMHEQRIIYVQCYYILWQNILHLLFCSAVTLPQCRHKPTDLRRYVLRFLIVVWISSKMYRIMFRLNLKNLYKNYLCHYVSHLEDCESSLNFPAWHLFCSSKKAWCPYKEFFCAIHWTLRKIFLRQTLNIKECVCAWCNILLTNNSYQPQYFQLGLTRFGSALFCSARRAVRTRP
jgi:hypothetical protein